MIVPSTWLRVCPQIELSYLWKVWELNLWLVLLIGNVSFLSISTQLGFGRGWGGGGGRGGGGWVRQGSNVM